MPPIRSAECGLALVCALMLLVAAMAIGVAVARGAFGALAGARNERDRAVAWSAAEAALRDAERDIAGTAAPARAALFAATGAEAFVDDCGHGPADLGLCRATSPPAWQRIDLADAEAPALVPYGHYTQATLATAHGLAPARLPAYLIERLAPAGAAVGQGSFYRISAIGFGMRASTRVVLQSLYHKPEPAADAAGDGTANGAAGDAGAAGSGEPAGAGADGAGAANGGDGAAGSSQATGGTPAAGSGGAPAGNPGATPAADPNAAPGQSAPPPHPLPAGRIGWREIANWPELHARARP